MNTEYIYIQNTNGEVVRGTSDTLQNHINLDGAAFVADPASKLSALWAGDGAVYMYKNTTADNTTIWQTDRGPGSGPILSTNQVRL